VFAVVAVELTGPGVEAEVSLEHPVSNSKTANRAMKPVLRTPPNCGTANVTSLAAVGRIFAVDVMGLAGDLGGLVELAEFIIDTG
jgi:hypothetical protein